MNNVDVETGTGATQTSAGLTQWQRVGDTFVAPSMTFEDIKRGNKSWWLPYLISVLLMYVLFAAVTMKVSWTQVAKNNLAMNPKQAQGLENAPAERRAQTLKMIGVVTEIITAASPITILIFASIVSLILWGTINFVFGGKATFAQIFAVNMYAALPRALLPILASAAIYAGLAPESFNLNNMAATNVAYFLSFQDTNKVLYTLLSQLDIVGIWVAILLSIGIAKVAGKGKGAGFATVFGWWAVITFIMAIYAYATS